MRADLGKMQLVTKGPPEDLRQFLQWHMTEFRAGEVRV